MQTTCCFCVTFVFIQNICRYDPFQDSWERLSEMQEKRCSFSVVVLDQKLYAIGGQCELDHLDSVELYCPTTDSWRYH